MNMSGRNPTPGLVALGERVKDLRQRRGFRQADLAARLGVGQATVAQIERGARRMDVVEVVVLARILGIPPGDLFGLVSEATPADQHF